MRILITGSGGQLGHALCATLGTVGDLILPSRSACDLTSPAQLRSMVSEAQPDVIVNCAAYTNVNGAESDRQGTFAVNAVAPGVLAESAKRCGALLIHFSTDYVFDGNKPDPYIETDTPAPLNVYGSSKLAGEEAVAGAGGRHLIFRTSWVYSAHGSNFVRTMLRLGRERETIDVVDDQMGAPTSTLQLATAIQRLLKAPLHTLDAPDGPWGLYHLTAAGAISWCGFARAIFAEAEGHAGLMVREVRGVATKDYPSPVARPRNSILSNQKFQRVFGFGLGSWEQALRSVLLQESRAVLHSNSERLLHV